MGGDMHYVCQSAVCLSVRPLTATSRDEIISLVSGEISINLTQILMSTG